MFGNCQPNRTPIWLGSVMEHNQTHNNIWSIEKNGMLNCRTVDNRTQSNVRLPNPFVYRSFLKYCKHFVRCTAPWLVLHDLLYQETDSEQNRIGLSSIVFDWFENRIHSRIDVWFCLITEPNRTICVRLGLIDFWFDFVWLDTPGENSKKDLEREAGMKIRTDKSAWKHAYLINYHTSV